MPTVQRQEYAASINKMMDTFQYRVEVSVIYHGVACSEAPPLFHVMVIVPVLQHLFSCDLDGKELRNVADCVERLNLLEEMGRVWAQSMLLEVRGASLMLSDVQTKVSSVTPAQPRGVKAGRLFKSEGAVFDQEELESVALSDVLEMKAVLDGSVFNSLLTVSVKQLRRKATTIFMFQCDDVRVRANP